MLTVERDVQVPQVQIEEVGKQVTNSDDAVSLSNEDYMGSFQRLCDGFLSGSTGHTVEEVEEEETLLDISAAMDDFIKTISGGAEFLDQHYIDDLKAKLSTDEAWAEVKRLLALQKARLPAGTLCTPRAPSDPWVSIQQLQEHQRILDQYIKDGTPIGRYFPTYEDPHLTKLAD